MKNKASSSSDWSQKTKRSFPRTFIFILEILVIIALLLIWLSSESIQKSKNLWVLFFYSFPSEFLIAIVPHEPILLYFGKFFSPLTVSLVAVIGTALTEALNYSVFRYVTNMNFFKKIRYRKTVNRIVELFKKAPFIALCVAGLTPIPFYPFRFLVVMARYPLIKYISAVILSRTPRFFLLALLGYTLKFSDYILAILFVILIASANIPILIKYLKKKQGNKKNIV